MKDRIERIMNPCKNFPERIVAGFVDLSAYLYHIARYVFALPYVRGSVVLDAGCGTGYGSYAISGSCAERVVGIDIDANAIYYAHRIYGHSRLGFIIGDITSPPFKSASFDVVISFEAVEHLGNPSEFLMECHRILNTDRGDLILSTPNKKRFSLLGQNLRNPFHVNEFTKKELEMTVATADFRIMDVRSQGKIQEGKKVDLIWNISCMLARLVPSTIGNLIRLLLGVLLYRVSLRNAFTYYWGEPKEIAGAFSNINLPRRYCVLHAKDKENPNNHQFFIVAARKIPD